MIRKCPEAALGSLTGYVDLDDFANSLLTYLFTVYFSELHNTSIF